MVDSLWMNKKTVHRLTRLYDPFLSFFNADIIANAGCRRCRRGHALRWDIVHTARGQQDDQARQTRELFE